jgi:hypothetical protein
MQDWPRGPSRQPKFWAAYCAPCASGEAPAAYSLQPTAFAPGVRSTRFPGRSHPAHSRSRKPLGALLRVVFEPACAGLSARGHAQAEASAGRQDARPAGTTPTGSGCRNGDSRPLAFGTRGLVQAAGYRPEAAGQRCGERLVCTEPTACSLQPPAC